MPIGVQPPTPNNTHLHGVLQSDVELPLRGQRNIVAAGIHYRPGAVVHDVLELVIAYLGVAHTGRVTIRPGRTNRGDMASARRSYRLPIARRARGRVQTD